MRTVSMASTFPADRTLLEPGPAEESIGKTIRSGQILGTSVVRSRFL
jgi:hypothetical protein